MRAMSRANLIIFNQLLTIGLKIMVRYNLKKKIWNKNFDKKNLIKKYR